MGLVGYLLLGKKGLAVVALVDWANRKMAEDLAQNWDFLNKSEVTGRITDSNLGGYQLGAFNNAQNFQSFDEWAKSIGNPEGDNPQIDETNSIPENIAQQLRARPEAVAG